MPAAAERTDVVYLTARETAARIRAGALSAEEAARAYLARIRALQPALNAVTDLCEDAALERAREADRALMRGEAWAPLHGVPITIKDTYDVAGMRTTLGYPPLARNVAAGDADAVARLRAAGAVVLGKTNTPLGAYDWQCSNPVFGRTRNPWDRARTPGGSSGGSAAAVAAGLAALELGSDVAGSIRVPTHFCGVCGIKPTEGRVSGAGHGRLPGAPRSLRHMCCYGPLARSVDDLELVMSLLADPPPDDAEAPPVPFRPAPPRAPSELRIAWTDGFAGLPVAAEVRDAVRGVAERLAAAGARVERAAPERLDVDDALRAWGEINGFEVGAAMPAAARLALRAGADFRFGRSVWTRGLRRGLALDARRYFAALTRRDAHAAEVEAFLAPFDAWLCPVTATPAFTHRRTGKSIDVDGRRVAYSIANGGFVCILNLTGHPVVVVPAAKSAAGLPIGVQIVARRWDDAGALAVARVVESLTGGFTPPPGLAG